MSEVITLGDIIRSLMGGLACLGLLYGADRAIVFHGSMFRTMYSNDKPERLYRERPKVLTGPGKVLALIVTTVSFCATVLTNGGWVATIAVAVAGFLIFIGLSLAETLAALRKLQKDH